MAQGRWTSRAATALLGCVLVGSLTQPAPAAQASPVRSDRAHGERAHQDRRTAHRARRDEDPADAAPLQITIDDLSPGVLPRQGPVVVSGTVTNVDSVSWRKVNLYPYLDTDSCVAASTCSAPMHSSAELAAGAAADPTSPVGERVTETSETIATIAPKQSVSFTLVVPQKVLRSEVADPQPGVYWFGVQAIGESSTTPRDLVADGRGRTFLPYVPDGFGQGTRRPAATVPTAIVVPVRAPIRHLRDGRIAGQAGWRASLATSGYLGNALALGEAAGSHPFSWMVDPAVPDAVRQLAGGDAGRLIPVPGEGASSSPSASSSGLGTGTSGSSSAGPLAAAASSWLEEARKAFGTGQLLRLPYGDTELVGSSYTRQLYSWARAQKGLLREWKLPSRRVIASPDGYVDPDGLSLIKDNSLVLLGDDMLPGGRIDGTLGEHPVLATSTAAAGGGPAPGDRFTTVQVRQRILSEAALRLLDGDTRPMVVQLPSEMGAGSAAVFWSGLDQPWLHLTTVGSALKAERSTIDPHDLRFPSSEAVDQVSLTTQSEAEQLVAEGRLLQSVLTPSKDPDSPVAANDRLASAVTAEALSGTSYSLRGDDLAGIRLARSRAWLRDQLGGISISAPPGVTLSSSEGSFAVTVTNNLDVPVTVQVATEAEGARVKRTDPIELAARSRSSVRLDAHTSRAGVHNIRLTLTDAHGTPLGSSVTVPIRSGSVGVVIWAILGTGAGILFVAIAIRLYRRFRRHGSVPEADAPEADVPSAEAGAGDEA